MGWHLLETLLQQAGEHSTLVGKLWVTATFVFRFVIVASVGDAVYSDEQSDFTCNTGQPGCENVCFNRFSPISHLRFWAAQIIVVSTPYIFFIVFTMHILMQMPQGDEEGQPEEGGDGDVDPNMFETGGTHDVVIAEQPAPSPAPSRVRRKRGKAGKGGRHVIAPRPLPDREVPVAVHHSPKNYPTDVMDEKESLLEFGSIHSDENDPGQIEQDLRSKNKERRIKRSVQAVYTLALLIRTASEIVFIWLQVVLYGFNVVEIYKCSRTPCPNIVDCFVSRPREKTLFLWFMFAVSVLCIVLSVAEIKYLGVKRIRKLLLKRQESRRIMSDKPAARIPKIIVGHDEDDVFNNDGNGKVNDEIPSAPPKYDPKSLYKETDYRNSWDEDSNHILRDAIGFDMIGRVPDSPAPPFPKVHKYDYLKPGLRRSSMEEEDDEEDEDHSYV